MFSIKCINHSASPRISTISGIALILFSCFAQSLHADMLRISEDEAMKSVVAKVIPTVPPIAKQAHLSGRVVVDLTVGESGSVEKTDVISGNPILGGAAARAGKGWMFKPFAGADGKPSKAVVRVSFAFGA